MRHPAPEAPKTQLAELISSKMEERGVTMRDLATEVDTTYEHVRRIVRGEGLPSRYVLKDICEKLGLDYHEAEKLATADKITKRYGTIPLELSGKDPSIAPLERVWSKLNAEQQGTLVDMATSFLRRKRAAS